MLGIFVHPIDAQNEGLQPVLDNLEAVGATAICISPKVGRPVAETAGVRFPPLHVDGHRRVLARPLWGRRALHLEFYLGYQPDLRLYAGGPYRPPSKKVPPQVDATLPARLIAEAHSRGLEAHMLIAPFLPPGIRRPDQPQRIDGSVPEPPQVALSACLNSPAARAYALALVEDTVAHYPDLDGLFTDWAEYGAYRLEDHLACFCPHCEAKARAEGLDWEGIRQDVGTLWDRLHTLSPRDLARARRLLSNPSELLALLTRAPHWLAFLHFKARTVVGFYRQVRQLLDNLGHKDMALSARGWPPPWNLSSGMDYGALADICQAVTPKLFTFDYCALPRWYGETLRAWNARLPEGDILDTLLAWMNLPDELEPRTFSRYHIPAPDELHPAKVESYRLRLDEVADQVRGRARLYPFAHAYLPQAQWAEMVDLLRDSPVDGLWVQMYGYLSDEKFKILEQHWR